MILREYYSKHGVIRVSDSGNHELEKTYSDLSRLFTDIYKIEDFLNKEGYIIKEDAIFCLPKKKKYKLKMYFRL